MSNKRIASTLTKEQRTKIFASWLFHENKTLVAKMHGVSARTVGRIVDEFNSELKNNTPDEISDVAQVEVSQDEIRTVEDIPVMYDLEEPLEETAHEFFVVATRDLVNVTRVDIKGKYPSNSMMVQRGEEKFEEVFNFIKNDDIEGAYKFLDEAGRIENITHGKLTLDTAVGVLEYKDGSMHHTFSASLTNRALDMVSEGGDVTPLLNFAERLINNPSPRAVNELYDFLVASDIEITEEGLVRCYKRVTEDYKDVYTRTFDNSIGATVQMKRFMVNDDSEQTCSEGLHVCSKAYLNHYGGSRVIYVDVDPADFVSIPRDYYTIDGNTVKAKARVCKYVVVGELIEE